MEIEFLAKFNKDLDRIEDTIIKRKVIKIIEQVELSENFLILQI